MKIEGQSHLDAAPEAVWPLLFDPGTLLQLLPGCEEVLRLGDGEYRARVTLPLAAVAGTYDAHVFVMEIETPRFCRLRGEATGSGGSVRGTASFILAGDGGGSSITYRADAEIAGPLSGMNPRFAEGVAQSLIRQGLALLPELSRQHAEPTGANGSMTGREPGHTDSGTLAGSGREFRIWFGALAAGFIVWLASLKRRLRRAADN